MPANASGPSPPVVNRPSTSSMSRPSRGSRSSSGADTEQRKSSSGSQRVCRYCFQGYSESDNRKGTCAEAPDPTANYVELLSCVCCASILAYHCFADDDGDYEHPCAPYAPASTVHDDTGDELDGPTHSCDTTAWEEKPMSDNGAPKSWRKWTLMSLLAVCVPCLCLYFPLRACHRWALRHHIAGGKHEAVTASRSDMRQHSGIGSTSKYSVPEEKDEDEAEEDDDVIITMPDIFVSEDV